MASPVTRESVYEAWIERGATPKEAAAYAESIPEQSYQAIEEQTKTWGEVLRETARAQSEKSGEDYDDVADAVEEDFISQLKQYGMPYERFIEKHMNEPYRPLDQIIQEETEGAEAAQARAVEEEYYRTPGLEAKKEQAARVSGQIRQKWAGRVGPVLATRTPPPMTPSDATQPRPQVDVPVTLRPPEESRYEMEQRLGRRLSREEYEEIISTDLSQRALEATIIDDKPVEDYYYDPERRERAGRAVKAAETLRGRRDGRLSETYAEDHPLHPKNRAEARQREGYDRKDPVTGEVTRQKVRRYGGGWRGGTEELPEEPDWTQKVEADEYISELLRNTDVNRQWKTEKEREEYEETGGWRGVVARPLGATAGATYGLMSLAGEGIEEYLFGLHGATMTGILRSFQGGILPDSFKKETTQQAEYIEDVWGKRLAQYEAGTHWSQSEGLKGANTEAMWEAFKHNNTLIESRLKDKDTWKALRSDFADNAAGLGELVATFMPTSLDILRAVRQTGDVPEDSVDRAWLTFKHGFK